MVGGQEVRCWSDSADANCLMVPHPPFPREGQGGEEFSKSVMLSNRSCFLVESEGREVVRGNHGGRQWRIKFIARAISDSSSNHEWYFRLSSVPAASARSRSSHFGFLRLPFFSVTVETSNAIPRRLKQSTR
jgi:hypothetical protein